MDDEPASQSVPQQSRELSLYKYSCMLVATIYCEYDALADQINVMRLVLVRKNRLKCDEGSICISIECDHLVLFLH